jgi:hypothetical protein
MLYTSVLSLMNYRAKAPIMRLEGLDADLEHSPGTDEVDPIKTRACCCHEHENHRGSAESVFKLLAPSEARACGRAGVERVIGGALRLKIHGSAIAPIHVEGHRRVITDDSPSPGCLPKTHRGAVPHVLLFGTLPPLHSIEC